MGVRDWAVFSPDTSVVSTIELSLAILLPALTVLGIPRAMSGNYDMVFMSIGLGVVFIFLVFTPFGSLGQMD